MNAVQPVPDNAFKLRHANHWLASVRFLEARGTDLGDDESHEEDHEGDSDERADLGFHLAIDDAAHQRRSEFLNEAETSDSRGIDGVR